MKLQQYGCCPTLLGLPKTKSSANRPKPQTNKHEISYGEGYGAGYGSNRQRGLGEKEKCMK